VKRTLVLGLVVAAVCGGVARGQPKGDTIQDPILIAALPYHVVGTTLGFRDDYNEVCPFSSIRAPDVVHAYTVPPGKDLTVNISLCGQGTQYNTKLFVYQTVYTPGYPYACNDDYCAGGKSALVGVVLHPYNIYYIVVDGYGGQFGEYELEVIEKVAETCSPGAIYAQPLVNPDAWAPSDQEAGWAVADNVKLSAPKWLGAVRVWGIDRSWSGGNWRDCEEPDMVFDVGVFPPDGTKPDYARPIAQYKDVAAARSATTEFTDGHPVYRYDLTLSPACSLLASPNEYWIEVAGSGTPNDCWFLWLNENGNGVGDNKAYYRGVFPPELDYDMAFCLGAAAGLLADANCDGTVNFFDIDPFVLAMTNMPKYMSQYGCVQNCDCDRNGRVNFFDIDPFVKILIRP